MPFIPWQKEGDERAAEIWQFSEPLPHMHRIQWDRKQSTFMQRQQWIICGLHLPPPLCSDLMLGLRRPLVCTSQISGHLSDIWGPPRNTRGFKVYAKTHRKSFSLIVSDSSPYPLFICTCIILHKIHTGAFCLNVLVNTDLGTARAKMRSKVFLDKITLFMSLSRLKAFI